MPIYLQDDLPPTRRVELVIIDPTGRSFHVPIAWSGYDSFLAPSAFDRHWLPAVMALRDYEHSHPVQSEQKDSE